MAAKAYKEQNNNHLASRNDLEAVKTELRHETDLIKKDVEHIKYQLNTNVATKAELDLVKKDIEHIKDQMATKAEMAEVKKDIEHIKDQMATKLDIEKLCSRMDQMNANLLARMDQMNASLSSRMDKTDNNYGWVKVLGMAIITALIGLLLASPSVQHFFHGIYT